MRIEHPSAIPALEGGIQSDRCLFRIVWQNYGQDGYKYSIFGEFGPKTANNLQYLPTQLIAGFIGK